MMFQSSQFDSTPGFVSSQTADPSPSLAKSRDAQPMHPVTVKQIVGASSSDGNKSNFLIDGISVYNVKLVGMVFDKTTRVTDASFVIDDGTGRIGCTRWVNDAQDTQEVEELIDEIYVRVHGHLKSSKGKRQIVVYAIRPVKDYNEIAYHFIECAHAHSSNTRLQKNGSATLASSAATTPSNGQQAVSSSQVPQEYNLDGIESIAKMVLDYLQLPTSISQEQGISRNEIAQRMSTSTSHNFSSYPPFFRPKANLQGVDLEFDSDPRPKSCSLPTIDFEALEPAYLSQVCREWGMFRLTNHGVSPELLTHLHNHANDLFSHNFEWKKAIPTTPMLYFWGNPALTMSGNAQQKGPPPADRHNWLEGLNVSLTNISHFHYQDPLLQSFRCLLEEYGGHQTRLAKAIFNAMAENLDLSPPKSTSYLSPASGIIRVYRYLRCPTAERRWGIHEHTDSSVLSIIHQDQVGGLQVLKNNEWLDVEPIHDTLIVNLGDMMQAMSDDEYVSVTHRVKVNRVKERLSIGYFVFPAEDGVIETSNYKPFTYADFQAKNQVDLKTLGAKIGLPRFKKASHTLI